jgi:hypothetical protein
MRANDRTPHRSIGGKMERAHCFRPENAVLELILSIGLMVAALFCMVEPAHAHGRLGAAEGRCRLFIGPDIMNFTGYTPDASKNEFCEDIPATGNMIMVLDDEQPELRDMKVELRIVRDVGGEERENEDINAVTVAYREPKLYPTGTINFEHYFPEPGYFVGIVTVSGAHGERWVSRFPFSVGLSFVRTLPVYVVLVLGVIGAFFIYLKHRPLAPTPVKAPVAPQDPEPTPAE